MWPWKDPFDTAENYDRSLGVNRDPSWQTRGLPDHPLVWPAGIYWDKKIELKISHPLPLYYWGELR